MSGKSGTTWNCGVGSKVITFKSTWLRFWGCSDKFRDRGLTHWTSFVNTFVYYFSYGSRIFRHSVFKTHVTVFVRRLCGVRHTNTVACVLNRTIHRYPAHWTGGTVNLSGGKDPPGAYIKHEEKSNNVATAVNWKLSFVHVLDPRSFPSIAIRSLNETNRSSFFCDMCCYGSLFIDWYCYILFFYHFVKKKRNGCTISVWKLKGNGSLWRTVRRLKIILKWMLGKNARCVLDHRAQDKDHRRLLWTWQWTSGFHSGLNFGNDSISVKFLHNGSHDLGYDATYLFIIITMQPGGFIHKIAARPWGV